MDWLYTFLIDFVNALIRGLGAILSFILGLLPNSPFQKIVSDSDVSALFGFINYFIPVSAMIVILEAWVAVIAVYYIYQIVLRFIKIID